MEAHERRTAIWYMLCRHRHTTISCLAEKYGVSHRTIRYDIEVLSRTYPIETRSGKGGGIRLADWYRPGHEILQVEQMDFLLELVERLEGEEAKRLHDIIDRISHNDRP